MRDARSAPTAEASFSARREGRAPTCPNRKVRPPLRQERGRRLCGRSLSGQALLRGLLGELADANARKRTSTRHPLALVLERIALADQQLRDAWPGIVECGE